jgi:predicted dehydrogenase
MFNIGVIGISDHTQENILPALKTIQHAKIVGIASTNETKLSEIGSGYDIPILEKNWRSIIHNEKIRYIVVASNPSFHEQVIEECIKVDKPVFVDKPPATSSAKLQELINLNHVNTPIFVGYSFRHADPYQKFIETSEKISPIRQFKATYITNKPVAPLWHYDDVLTSYLYSVGIHPIEMATAMFGKIKSIYTSINHITNNDSIFSLLIDIEFTTGQKAQIECGNYSNRLVMEYEIVGENGFWGSLRDWYKFEFVLPKETHIVSNKEVISYQYPPARGGYYRTGYAAELEKFLLSSEENNKTDCDLVHSIPVYAVIDAVLKDNA